MLSLLLFAALAELCRYDCPNTTEFLGWPTSWRTEHNTTKARHVTLGMYWRNNHRGNDAGNVLAVSDTRIFKRVTYHTVQDSTVQCSIVQYSLLRHTLKTASPCSRVLLFWSWRYINIIHWWHFKWKRRRDLSNEPINQRTSCTLLGYSHLPCQAVTRAPPRLSQQGL